MSLGQGLSREVLDGSTVVSQPRDTSDLWCGDRITRGGDSPRINDVGR